MVSHSLSATDADIAHFQTFGFVHLRGVQRDEADRITVAFEEVFAQQPATVGRAGRAGVTRIAERSETLRKVLLAEHRCPNLARQLLAAPVSYVGGDGVRYSGPTYWHRDGDHRELRLLKIVQYLEPLDVDGGALRIIPGTHRRDTGWDGFATQLSDPERHLGVLPTDMPCFAIVSEPADLIAFDPHCYHASFGGADGRRQLTVTYAAAPQGDRALAELANYLLADRSVL